MQRVKASNLVGIEDELETKGGNNEKNNNWFDGGCLVHATGNLSS
jgi:hypothetical protein